GGPARRDHRGHPVRLGAPEARRSGAMADREGDRTGAERAAPVAARLCARQAVLRYTSVEMDECANLRGTELKSSEVQISCVSRKVMGLFRKGSPSSSWPFPPYQPDDPDQQARADEAGN